MFSILGLDHVVLRTENIPRMVRFYRDVLGCTVERERPEIGLTQLRAGQSLIDLLAVERETGRSSGPEPARDAHNMDHLCLRIELFDPGMLAAHLIRHGIVPGEVKSRYGADGQGPSIYIDDPEGNRVELKGLPAS